MPDPTKICPINKSTALKETKAADILDDLVGDFNPAEAMEILSVAQISIARMIIQISKGENPVTGKVERKGR